MKGNVEGSPAADGYGRSFTVEDLRARERADLRARVSKELWDEGVRAVRAKLEAEASLAAVRVALHRGLGGDAAATICQMITEAARLPVELPKQKRK